MDYCIDRPEIFSHYLFLYPPTVFAHGLFLFHLYAYGPAQTTIAPAEFLAKYTANRLTMCVSKM